MSEVWGLMPKAQDNNQKIDDAIAAAIANHESDSEAHLGDGESLQSHKANDIIDHRAGSVAIDKLSNSDKFHLCSFESLDNWEITGTANLDGWPGVVLSVGYGGSTFSRILTIVHSPGGFINYSKTLLFQTTLFFDLEPNCKGWFGLGSESHLGVFGGFGFYYDNGDLKGFWGKPTDMRYTSVFTVDLTVLHTFRAQYDPLTNTVYFFIDGVQVGSITFDIVLDNLEPELFFSIDLKSYDDAFVIYITNVLISST